MDRVYVVVSTADNPVWCDFFFMERDRDPDAEAAAKYPDLKNVKVQVSEVTRIR